MFSSHCKQKPRNPKCLLAQLSSGVGQSPCKLWEVTRGLWLPGDPCSPQALPHPRWMRTFYKHRQSSTFKTHQLFFSPVQWLLVTPPLCRASSRSIHTSLSCAQGTLLSLFPSASSPNLQILPANELKPSQPQTLRKSCWHFREKRTSSLAVLQSQQQLPRKLSSQVPESTASDTVSPQ